MTDNATENTNGDGAATFAAGTDHAINAPDGGVATDSGAPVATAPTGDTASATPTPTPDGGTVSDTTGPVADAVATADVVPVPADGPVSSAVSTDTSDVDALIRDVHKMVTDIHAQVDKVKPLLEQASPVIQHIADEVKAKGIAGLIPLLMSAFRG